MKAKMLNQIVQRGKEKTTKYERKRNLDKDLWSTSYVTNIKIDVMTDDAEQTIENFCEKHFGDKNIFDVTIERNGMLGFWQFTIITAKENTDFEIIEETEEQVTERLMAVVQNWYDKKGYQNYEYDMYIDKIEELSDNKLKVYLKAEDVSYGDTVILSNSN